MPNRSEAPKPPVVVVTGPTASGKTPLAIEIARRFGGEIVNADSMQVYRYMDIGTAKPTPEERARVPHHLLDVVTPDVTYSAGRYSEAARVAARSIHARGHLVVLTGGTGLYIRAFLHGLLQTGGADASLRDQLETEHEVAVSEDDPHRLHRQLAERDPASAARIHPNDVRRIIRALEICRQSGAPVSVVRGEHAFGDAPFRSLHLALDPGVAALDERIDARCVQMIEGGLLREVRGLRARGYGPELRPLQAIGYRHLAAVADGSDTLANALVALQRDTRRFARRQRTWLRAVPEVIWMQPGEVDAIYARVEAFVREVERAEPGPPDQSM